MSKVRIDINRVQGAAIAAFRDTCFQAHRQMIQTISDPGIFPGFDGDIVDQGVLRSSQQPPEINGNQATFRNTSEYALYVHEGATFKAGVSWGVREHKRKQTQAFGRPMDRVVTVTAHDRTRRNARTLLGRPWMAMALQQMDFARTFERNIAVRLK